MFQLISHQKQTAGGLNVKGGFESGPRPAAKAAKASRRSAAELSREQLAKARDDTVKILVYQLIGQGPGIILKK